MIALVMVDAQINLSRIEPTARARQLGGRGVHGENEIWTKIRRNTRRRKIGFAVRDIRQSARKGIVVHHKASALWQSVAQSIGASDTVAVRTCVGNDDHAPRIEKHLRNFGNRDVIHGRRLPKRPRSARFLPTQLPPLFSPHIPLPALQNQPFPALRCAGAWKCACRAPWMYR